METKFAEYASATRFRHFAVGDEYFDALGLKVLRGRLLTRDDGAGGTLVVVISARFAALLWPHDDPLGHTFRRGASGPTFTVVGVVSDVRDMQGIRGSIVADRRPDAYYSIRQVEASYPNIVIHARTSVENATLVATNELRAIDPQLVSRVTGTSGAAEAQTVAQVFGSVMGTFAVAGLLLSIIGLYGVVAYGIDQRKREIGVRLALGATGSSIVRLVVSRSMRFISLGILAGLALSAGMSRLLGVVLFQVSATQPMIYAATGTTFGAVALFACWWAARGAARIDPITSLKSD